MTRRETLLTLIDYFAQEALNAAEQHTPWCDVTELCYFNEAEMNDDELFNAYRSLVNVRPPLPVPEEIGHVQDEFLQGETIAKGVVEAEKLFIPGLYTEVSPSKKMAVWQGDITTLKIDAIVNAANCQMLGCFSPCHACIDNCIHTYAGTDLRLACDKMMKAQGYPEHVGGAKLTLSYNLPCAYVIHTVGPTVTGLLTQKQIDQLSSCYTSCLDLAEANELTSVAFCCISTGVFHFPNAKACSVAVDTVRSWFEEHHGSEMKVLFNVFKEEDFDLYSKEISR
jgi:O-acetyl-ADP-ribose deacetylase (regulator of RNase III)